MTLRLSSGLVVEHGWTRLASFLDQERLYYDGIPDSDPDHILPIDILAPMMMNAYWQASASPLRTLHQAIAAACDPLLPGIPRDADLVAAPLLLLDQVARIIEAAWQVKNAGLAVATKVLLRKRPGLIPMLDSVIREHYVSNLAIRGFAARLDDPQRRHAALLLLFESIHGDLASSIARLTTLAAQATARG